MNSIIVTVDVVEANCYEAPRIELASADGRSRERSHIRKGVILNGREREEVKVNC